MSNGLQYLIELQAEMARLETQMSDPDQAAAALHYMGHGSRLLSAGVATPMKQRIRMTLTA